VLPNEIAFALSINPGHVDRTLAFDEADNNCETAYFGGIESSM
jgi:hypothetical protein